MRRLRPLPLLAAIAVLIVTAFTGSSAVASTAAPNQPPSLRSWNEINYSIYDVMV